MNKNQLKGRLEQVADNAKGTVGKILDDDNMEMEGKVRKNVGKVRVRFADHKEDIKMSAEIAV
ncbi:MAG: CsbD family protein [Methylomonas sp.]|uniref:CsbD family protein n=1 Tax=Methylomonas sp. TaxID=418 RepID=UPI0025E4ACC2|nr:CsbD family protein [Methylomonas sp.]MCK9605095.1 CsbD family protein [Methylomonas sp.]